MIKLLRSARKYAAKVGANSLTTKLTGADIKNLLAIILGTKIVILVFGFQSFLFFANRKITGFHQFFGIWNHWDARNYLSIAEYGYVNDGSRKFEIVFFPLFPYLISAFNFLTRDAILSGFLISTVASLALGFLLFKLVKLDFSNRIALSSVWFLFIFPTSYFLHIPYTESLFLALVVGAFYFSRKRFWLAAGTLGLFACATRVNGLLIVLALPFEMFSEFRETRKLNSRWLYAGLAPLGFAGYLLLNYFVTGNALTFLDVQRSNFQKYLAPPWTGLWQKLSAIYHSSETVPIFEGIFEIAFVGIGLLTIVAGWRCLRGSYRVWMIANWLLFISTSWILSVPRYTLSMFPMFIVLAVAARKRLLNVLITTLSILYLGMFIILFVQDRWAF